MSLLSWIGGLLNSGQTPVTPVQAPPAPAPVPTPAPTPVAPVPQQPAAAPVAASGPFQVTAAQLAAIMPKGAAQGVDFATFAQCLNRTFALPSVHITTAAEVALFVAESAYESMEYTHLREIWNPAQVPEQNNYEGSKILGNTQPGDGYKFRGGGLPQLTGRWAYTSFSNWSGIDFVSNPDLITQPLNASLAFGWFWNWRKLSTYADVGNIDQASIVINGGTNGLAGREAYYKTACGVFGVNWG
jgi:predicted chitinase